MESVLGRNWSQRIPWYPSRHLAQEKGKELASSHAAPQEKKERKCKVDRKEVQEWRKTNIFSPLSATPWPFSAWGRITHGASAAGHGNITQQGNNDELKLQNQSLKSFSYANPAWLTLPVCPTDFLNLLFDKPTNQPNVDLTRNISGDCLNSTRCKASLSSPLVTAPRRFIATPPRNPAVPALRSPPPHPHLGWENNPINLVTRKWSRPHQAGPGIMADISKRVNGNGVSFISAEWFSIYYSSRGGRRRRRRQRFDREHLCWDVGRTAASIIRYIFVFFSVLPTLGAFCR